MNVYDVALWRYWPSSNFPYIADNIVARSPLLAALAVMQHYRLKHVVHVAVKLPDCSIQRWDNGLSLYVASSQETDEEVSGCPA